MWTRGIGKPRSSWVKHWDVVTSRDTRVTWPFSQVPYLFWAAIGTFTADRKERREDRFFQQQRVLLYSIYTVIFVVVNNNDSSSSSLKDTKLKRDPMDPWVPPLSRRHSGSTARDLSYWVIRAWRNCQSRAITSIIDPIPVATVIQIHLPSYSGAAQMVQLLEMNGLKLRIQHSHNVLHIEWQRKMSAGLS